MYIDAQQQYSVQQALTVTAISTNAIDNTLDRNIGIGEPLVIVVAVIVGATGGGTFTVQLQTDSTGAFGSPVTVATSPAYPAAQLVAGFRFVVPIPSDLAMNRWSRLNYVLATMTGISVTAWLALESAVQNEFYVPAGITLQ